MAEERLYYDGPIVSVSPFAGWWVVEKGEHDGEHGLLVRSGGDAASLYVSSRLSDADVEGTREEIAALARAILAGGSAEFKRCAVEMDDTERYWLLWSPRNSRRRGMVPRERAETWARGEVDR